MIFSFLSCPGGSEVPYLALFSTHPRKGCRHTSTGGFLGLLQALSGLPQPCPQSGRGTEEPAQTGRDRAGGSAVAGEAFPVRSVSIGFREYESCSWICQRPKWNICQRILEDHSHVHLSTGMMRLVFLPPCAGDFQGLFSSGTWGAAKGDGLRGGRV